MMFCFTKAIRHASIECLGLFALLDEHVAGSYMPLFVKVLKHDSDKLKVTALSAVMDALLIFRQSSWNHVPAQLDTAYVVPGEDVPATEGDEAAGQDNEASKDKSSVWNLVFSCLHHDVPGVRGVAAEGLAKLVLGGRIINSKPEQQLLLALTLLYFSPLSEDDAQLRQCLAIFFPAFAAKDSANALALARLAMPTLKHIAAAPKGSQLAKVSALQVGQYLLSVMDEALVDTSVAVSSHLTVATMLLNAIIATPAHVNVKIWARMLNQIRINGSVDLGPLAELVTQAQENVMEPAACTAIAKFRRALDEVLEDKEDKPSRKNGGDSDEDDDGEAASAVDKMLGEKGGEHEVDDDELDDEEDQEEEEKKPKPRPTPRSPGLMHQVRQRDMSQDVNLGGLFGQTDAEDAGKPCLKGRGSAARRALAEQDEVEAAGGMLSPHSPIKVGCADSDESKRIARARTLVRAHPLTYARAQVRRSTRAAKPAVSALRKERELDRMLEQHEKREKASWRQRGQAEDEEED